MSIKVIAKNRKARFEYFLLDHYEAGLVLQGSEIKSIRAGHISIAEAYVRILDDEAWLIDAHIAPYDQASHFNHDPRRARKLLLHRTELNRLIKAVQTKGLTIIPTKVYLKNGRAKVEIALAKGKKHHDKRQVIAKRDVEREIQRQLHRGGG
jgi:SsrA-binding protein